MAAIGREEANPTRLRVRVVSFRRRLIDPDNLCPKYFIDCLRYAKIIPDDRAQDIILEVSQQKVQSKADECTFIEVELIEPIKPSKLAKTVLAMDRPELLEHYWTLCGSSWNRPAFDVFMETLSDEDLRRYITYGQ